MGIKLTNNAFATLAAGINSSVTSITLTTGQGARFPTLAGGDYFYATLVDTSNNLEIVKCTARSTDVLTVVRGQESTTARAYVTGDRIEIRITAATFTDATTVTPAAVSDQTNTSTGYFDLPSGTTAQRPGSPNTANLRYNTSLGVMEFYNGSAWQAMDVYGAGTYPVKYSVIGGGGGGGKGSTSYAAGGAGAGGMLEGIFFATVGTVYTTTIGAGGSGSSSNIAYAQNGNSSSISGSGLTTLNGFGGQRGSNTTATGDVWGTGQTSDAGGCGAGGGAGNNLSISTVFGFFGSSGTVGQGCGGGNMMYYSSSFNGGGGGGGTGRPGSSPHTGNGPVGGAAAGGNGRASIVNGTTYGGGGGGGYGDYQSGSMNNGGSGGGGQGGNTGTAAGSGSVNTGGGGGGGGVASFQNGGSGGSGRILISMPTLRYTGTTTGSPTVSTSGSDTILDFTSSGSFTA